MSIVKLKKENQKKVKVLSRIISVIAIIGKVITLILGPLVILCMIAVPVLFSKIDVKDDVITINKNTKINIIEDEDSIKLEYDGKLVAQEEDKELIQEFKNIFENNSKGRIIAYTEVSSAFVLIILVLMFLVFRHLQKLFNNIYSEDTPFTLENVLHIKRMAYLLIGVIVVPIIGDFASEIIFNREISLDISAVSLLEILFLFTMSYIFEYGYGLQLDSKGKMYGDIDE